MSRAVALGLASALAWVTCNVGAAAPALPAPLERPAAAMRDPQRAAMLGVARAGSRLVAVGERGAVVLSDDGGKTWRQAAAVPVSATLTAVQFVGERTGWAIGHYGVILRSDDGGEHWSRQLDGHAAAKLTLADAQAAGNARAIAEAERTVSEGADKPLLALHFADADNGLVTGAFGLLLATADGGKSWRSIASRLDNPRGAHLYALYRQGATVLVAGELGLLLHSADNGERFERVATPYKGSFFCVVREADGAWLVAGLRGTALRSRDGGKSWQALASPVPAGITAALGDSNGPVWLINQGGQVLAPSAQGDQLQLISQTRAQQPGQMLRLADGTLLVAGWNGITRTTPASGAQPPKN